MFRASHDNSQVKLLAIFFIMLISTVNISHAFETKQTSKAPNKARVGQVIHKTDLLKQPNYQSEIAGHINAKEKINIKSRKSAWYYISTMTIDENLQLSGWVNMLNIRYVASAKREGDLGIQSLISSAENDSLPTVSTGVRGFDENDLKNVQADFQQLIVLKTFSVSKADSLMFAQRGKLKVSNIKVKEK